MRAIRLSGSEGGGELWLSPYPYTHVLQQKRNINSCSELRRCDLPTPGCEFSS